MNWQQDGHRAVVHDVYDYDGSLVRDWETVCPFKDDPGHDCQFNCPCVYDIIRKSDEPLSEFADKDCDKCSGTGKQRGTCIFREEADMVGLEESWWVNGTDWHGRMELWERIPSGDYEIEWYFWSSGPDIYGEYDCEFQWQFKDGTVPGANLEIS